MIRIRIIKPYTLPTAKGFKLYRPGEEHEVSEETAKKLVDTSGAAERVAIKPKAPTPPKKSNERK